MINITLLGNREHGNLDRVINVHGNSFFVHTQVWNYFDDVKLFRAYPQVLQMDAQANVNRTSDGFNVVGVCGNYHNIVLLRSFIGDQRATTFRWIFHVAFMYLLGKETLLKMSGFTRSRSQFRYPMIHLLQLLFPLKNAQLTTAASMTRISEQRPLSQLMMIPVRIPVARDNFLPHVSDGF